jgi:hypothetical protein
VHGFLPLPPLIPPRLPHFLLKPGSLTLLIRLTGQRLSRRRPLGCSQRRLGIDDQSARVLSLYQAVSTSGILGETRPSYNVIVEVTGSIPVGSTNKIKGFSGNGEALRFSGQHGGSTGHLSGQGDPSDTSGPLLNPDEGVEIRRTQIGSA